jgi:hypothetical protein
VIGARIALVPTPPRAVLGWAGLAAALVGLGLGFQVPVVLGLAALPAALAATMALLQRRAFLARFTPTALEVATTREAIPYVSIRELRPIVPLGSRRPAAFAIEVVHDQGSLLLPARLSAPSERVYAFLREQMAGPGQPTLPASLDVYRREQAESFGPERVFTFGSRRGPYVHPGPGTRAAAFALIGAAALWLFAWLFRKDEPGWGVAAAAALGTGLLVLLIDVLRARPASRAAALVITPLGLALRQDDLDGHLTWAQIRDVVLRAGPAPFGAHRQGPGIILQVEGAAIVITDSYDRPLAEIHERIRQYWR